MIRLEDICQVCTGVRGSVETVKYIHLPLNTAHYSCIIGFSHAGKSPSLRGINLLECHREKISIHKKSY